MLKLKTIAMIAAGSVLLVGCATDNYVANDNANLANPASRYCTKTGGQSLVLVKDKASIYNGDIGFCRLADGTVVEEWKYYHARTTK